MRHLTTWHRNADGTVKRIGRLPFFLEVDSVLLYEVDKWQIIPHWYAPCWQPWDRDTTVWAQMGLHWVIRLGRWIYYAIRCQWPPERRELLRLRRENEQLKYELERVVRHAIHD